MFIHFFQSPIIRSQNINRFSKTIKTGNHALRKFCTLTSTNDNKAKLNVKYYWPKEARPKMVKIPMRYFEGRDRITTEDIHKYLVEDDTNLRRVAHVRYWKDKDGAFVNIPSKGILLHKLQDNTVELLLEKSHGRTEMIGPLTSFDPNLALIVDTLGPTIKPKFRAGGGIHTRAYQALISTIGVKFEACIRAQLAFVFKPPFKKLFFHEEIELGKGIDLIVTGICSITWVPFKETSGGILLVGYPLGIAAGISWVKGGVLRPLEDLENSQVPEHPPLKSKAIKGIIKDIDDDDHHDNPNVVNKSN